VHVGAHDSNAAFWGVCAAPALEGRAFTLLSTGTWFVAMRRARDGQCLACLDPERDMLANVDPTGRPVPSARFMGGREMAQIAGSTRIACTLEDLTWAVRSGAMVGPCRTPGTGPFPGGSDAGIGPSPSTPGQAAAIALLHGAAVSAAMIERLSPPGESVVIEGRFAQETRLAGVLAALSPARAIKVVNGPAGPELGALHLAGMGVGGPTLDHAEALALDLSDWHARWLDLAEARQRAIP
jgi:sugar (pentulose or hexulose) kinase